MVTVDRSPGKNYLAETLKNLDRGGVFNSEHLHSFHLFNSDDKSNWLISNLIDYPTVYVNVPTKKLVANQNVAEALAYAALLDEKWVLFLEDDIDVCDSFIDSVYYWLEEHYSKDVHLYAIGSPYPEIKMSVALGMTKWDYPIKAFYGTQSIAFHSDDAWSFSKYMKDHIFTRNKEGVCYDLHMQDWALKNWPSQKFFMASVPSFSQHIGMTSIIHQRASIHTFPSFPGHDWKYESQGVLK
jgi:hypothetical protein